MKKNKLLIGLGSLMVINLPLLATISCNNETNTNSIINQINGETIVKSPLYRDDSFKSTWAHSESYTNEQVKSFIETNKDKIFHNLPQETTISSIESVYKVVEGKIEVKVKFSGKIHNKEGQLVDVDSNKEYKVELIGFKTTNLTTYLSSTELDIKEISELSSKKASEIKSLDQENLKNKIKDLVKDLFLDKAIEVSDIEITTQDSNANDAKGTLDLKLSIKNNKAWENGVKKESKEFNLKLTGFKIQAPTTIANFEIKDLKKSIFSKHYAIPYGKWDSTTVATTTENQTNEQANEAFLKTELEKYVKSIFNNEPEDVKIKDVKINKDYTIGSIQNGYDSAHGAVYIVVTLDKYYDENGKLVDTSSTSIDENKGKFYFKLTGFKVDEKITTHLDYKSLYDDTTNNAIRLTTDTFTEQASNANSSFFQSSFEKLILKKITLKQESSSITSGNTEQQPTEPKYTLDKIKNKVYGDSNWTSKNEINPSVQTKQVNEEELIKKIKEHIYIDWENNNIIADDTRGILTLEVTFKNIWWKNGVFVKEHKEVMRFSGFRTRWTKPMYNPYLSIIEEEVVQKNGTSAKEKIAITSNQTISQINLEEIVKEVVKNQETADPKKTITDKIKLELEKDIANNAEGLSNLIVGLRDYSSIKVENVNINDSLDTVSFTLLINNEKFNFKWLGFLGKNNKTATPSSPEALTQGTTTQQQETNSNNNTATQDNFEFKWVGHSYSDSEGIKVPQFYGHYWYSFEITIKDDVSSKENVLIDKTTPQAFYEKIKNNKLSDFYLIKRNLEIIPYEIVDNKNNSITIKFKHEEWSSIHFLAKQKVEKQNQEQTLTKPPYYLAVSNLGSFDFEKIFPSSPSAGIAQEPLQQPTYKEEVLLNPSIFAAEFVKDNYDQYGSIKLKGYDLPIDIDQYDFWYKDEASQEFKGLDNSKANIVEKYEAQVDGKKVNVFVEIQFNLDGTEKLSKNTKLYVSLKNDQNNKHLIKI